MTPRDEKEAKKKQQGRPRGAQNGGREGQKWYEWHWQSDELCNFGAPGPPKGSKILEKASMLDADCRL